jgi:hypothetical protein
MEVFIGGILGELPDTATKTPQVYQYQIEATLASGRVTTLVSGKLTLDPDL